MEAGAQHRTGTHTYRERERSGERAHTPADSTQIRFTPLNLQTLHTKALPLRPRQAMTQIVASELPALALFIRPPAAHIRKVLAMFTRHPPMQTRTRVPKTRWSAGLDTRSAACGGYGARRITCKALLHLSSQAQCRRQARLGRELCSQGASTSRGRTDRPRNATHLVAPSAALRPAALLPPATACPRRPATSTTPAFHSKGQREEGIHVSPRKKPYAASRTLDSTLVYARTGRSGRARGQICGG